MNNIIMNQIIMSSSVTWIIWKLFCYLFYLENQYDALYNFIPKNNNQIIWNIGKHDKFHENKYEKC